MHVWRSDIPLLSILMVNSYSIGYIAVSDMIAYDLHDITCLLMEMVVGDMCLCTKGMPTIDCLAMAIGDSSLRICSVWCSLPITWALSLCPPIHICVHACTLQ